MKLSSMANRIANPIYANPDVRHMMDKEDEILGELEDLDTRAAACVALRSKNI